MSKLALLIISSIGLLRSFHEYFRIKNGNPHQVTIRCVIESITAAGLAIIGVVYLKKEPLDWVWMMFDGEAILFAVLTLCHLGIIPLERAKARRRMEEAEEARRTSTR